MQAKFLHGSPVMVDFTPSAAGSAGDVIVANSIVTILHTDVEDARLAARAVGGGVYEVAGDAAISIGKRVFWDDSTNKATETASGNKPLGWAVSACSGDAAKFNVLHVPGGEKQAAVVAANATAAASDLTTAQALANSLQTTVNAILTSLKNSGQMASS